MADIQNNEQEQAVIRDKDAYKKKIKTMLNTIIYDKIKIVQEDFLNSFGPLYRPLHKIKSK